MYQIWDKLLFLHWPIQAERLRPLIPAALELDIWQGTAWIGVVPFTISGIRPPLFPPLPVLSSTHELNVRTYVHCDGIPGVWFFSLDASSRFAVWAARLAYSLPYYKADIDLYYFEDRVDFRSMRTDGSAAHAEFQATWQLGSPLPTAAPESREYFLTERYCLYSVRGRQLYRARVYHQPWPLFTANIESLTTSMLEAHGLHTPEQPPLVHALAEPLRVEMWPLNRVKTAEDASPMAN